MDMSMFDVTNTDVHRGGEVVFYGKGGMPMEEIAALTGSINCEPLSRLTHWVAEFTFSPTRPTCYRLPVVLF